MARLLLVAVLAASVHAGDVVQLVHGPRYERGEAFQVSGVAVQGFVARDGPAYFLVREDGDWTYAYRFERGAVHLLAADADPATAEATRVAAGRDGRALVERSLRAAASWDDHKRFLPDALAGDAATAHAAWRRVCRSLERAHDEHPGHLGILRDLIVAYSRLNAFEQGTVTATNLCRLLPARIAEYEEAAGELSEDERHTLEGARALMWFECGLYPLVGTDDPVLRRAMAALGQTGFADRETFTTRGELATYEVRVVETGGTPPSGKLLFDEIYFLTRLRGGTEPVGRVWYVLSRQALDGTPRFYLYGCSGESRSLLMMYGKERPSYELARADVERAMTRALVKRAALVAPRAAESPDAFVNVMAGALVIAVVLVVVAFLIARKRALCVLLALAGAAQAQELRVLVPDDPLVTDADLAELGRLLDDLNARDALAGHMAQLRGRIAEINRAARAHRARALALQGEIDELKKDVVAFDEERARFRARCTVPATKAEEAHCRAWAKELETARAGLTERRRALDEGALALDAALHDGPLRSVQQLRAHVRDEVDTLRRPLPAPGARIGHAIAVRGDVFQRTAQGLERITEATPIHEGAMILTGEGSFELRFDEGTVCRVGPGSIAQFDPEEPSMVRGTIRFLTTEPKGRFEGVRTTVAIVAVRGTDFIVDVDADGGVIVSVLEGGVTVTAGATKVDLDAPQRIEVRRDGTVGSPVKIDVASTERVWRTLMGEAEPEPEPEGAPPLPFTLILVAIGVLVVLALLLRRKA